MRDIERHIIGFGDFVTNDLALFLIKQIIIVNPVCSEAKIVWLLPASLDREQADFREDLSKVLRIARDSQIPFMHIQHLFIQHLFRSPCPLLTLFGKVVQDCYQSLCLQRSTWRKLLHEGCNVLAQSRRLTDPFQQGCHGHDIAGIVRKGRQEVIEFELFQVEWADQ